VSAEFDREAFLEWLDEQTGPVKGSTLENEWPDAPTDQLFGITCPRIDDEWGYYRIDLRRMATKRRIID
jgi:hypothetical protein